MSMKSIFPEYYRPDASSLADAWKTCTFILDANILLSFYRLTAESREDLFSTLEAVKNRVWVPYHAALEYQRNKMSVIADQKALIDSITTHIDKSLASLEGGLSGHQMIEPGPVIAEVKQVLDRYKDKLKTLGLSQADVHDPDVIGERIDKLVSGRVGTVPDQKTIDAVEKEGEARFDREIPPGFRDAQKKGSFVCQGLNYKACYGDLHVWKQILDKIESDKLRSVIFLSQDAKDDWWLRVKGKTIGPHPELRAEAATAGALSFQIYSLPQFLEFAKKELNQKISANSIKHAHELDEMLPEFINGTDGKPVLRVRLAPMEEHGIDNTVGHIMDIIGEVLGPGFIEVSQMGEEWVFWTDAGASDSETAQLAKGAKSIPGVVAATGLHRPVPSQNRGINEISVVIQSEKVQESARLKIRNILKVHKIEFNENYFATLLILTLKNRVPYFLMDTVLNNIRKLDEVVYCEPR